MKRKLYYICLLFSSFLVISSKSFAQQDAQYSHYMFNGLVISPAVAGSKEALSVVGLFRTQFVGIEGGPVTQTVSAHMPFAKLHGGLGLHIINDQFGKVNRNLSFMPSYAYRYDMGSGVLAAGIGLGFMQRTLDGTKLLASDPNDPLIPAGSVNDVAMDVNLGVLYTTNNYYAGLSASHLNRGKFDIQGASEYRNVVHYYLTGGYNYNLTPAIDIKPSILFKYTKSLQFDVSTMVFYNQKFWGGLSYRLNDALIGLVGFNITPQIKFSYSYDYTLSKLNLASQGSHEVLLGYDVVFVKKIKTEVILKTPRFL